MAVLETKAGGGKCKADVQWGGIEFQQTHQLARCSAVPQLLSGTFNPSPAPQGTGALQVALPVHGHTSDVCLEMGTGLILVHFTIYKHIFIIWVS